MILSNISSLHLGTSLPEVFHSLKLFAILTQVKLSRGGCFFLQYNKTMTLWAIIAPMMLVLFSGCGILTLNLEKYELHETVIQGCENGLVNHTRGVTCSYCQDGGMHHTLSHKVYLESTTTQYCHDCSGEEKAEGGSYQRL